MQVKTHGQTFFDQFEYLLLGCACTRDVGATCSNYMTFIFSVFTVDSKGLFITIKYKGLAVHSCPVEVLFRLNLVCASKDLS